MPELDEMLRPDEVAARLKRSENTLKYWRRQGTGPRWARIGRGVMYRTKDVQEWLDEQFEQDDPGPTSAA